MIRISGYVCAYTRIPAAPTNCAHPDGLGCPIRGDELYGQPADRLYLHAETLELTHPTSGQRMTFRQPADF